MKILFGLTAAILMSATSVSAFDMPSMPTDAPTENGWAIGMVERACRINLNLRDHHGTISRVKDGVIYRAFDRSGRLVASARATSTLIFAKKVCTFRR